jgi:hypothetical protein
MRVGEEVHCRDFRDFSGASLPIPTLRFDAAQYEAEVERASKDRSWINSP